MIHFFVATFLIGCCIGLAMLGLVGVIRCIKPILFGFGAVGVVLVVLLVTGGAGMILLIPVAIWWVFRPLRVVPAVAKTDTDPPKS